MFWSLTDNLSRFLGPMSRNTERDLCKTPETLFMNYPERFAQEALGHNSKAVHCAYAKRALMKIPSLEDYEQRATAKVEPTA
jgi:hypothetical protein